MDIEQTTIIDKAHNALANVITNDMEVYLSPSKEVIPFGLLLRDVLITLGYGVKRAPYLCNNAHAGGAHLLVFSTTRICVYYCRRAIIDRNKVLTYTVNAYYGEVYNHTNNIYGIKNMLDVLDDKVQWLHMKNQYTQ